MALDTSSEKAKFLAQLRIDASTMMQLYGVLSRRKAVYMARGYNSGGTDPVTETQANEAGLSLSRITEIASFLDQFNNFMGNAAVMTGDYAGILNRSRNDV